IQSISQAQILARTSCNIRAANGLFQLSNRAVGIACQSQGQTIISCRDELTVILNQLLGFVSLALCELRQAEAQDRAGITFTQIHRIKETSLCRMEPASSQIGLTKQRPRIRIMTDSGNTMLGIANRS